MDQKLSELVEELTTSGEPQVNPEKMKELKKICRSSEEQLGRTYHLLMAQLSQEHAEVRLSAFQVLDQLFARSHHFRMLVVSNFQEFLELTLGTDHERPLPPPREVAQKLRQAATRAIRGWNEKYGTAYKKLALGFHFLTHNKQVDFQDVDARTLAERKRAEEKQKRLDRIYKERSEQAAREMEEMSGEIRSCLMELESCFRLLVPFDLDPTPGAAWPAMAEEGGRDEEQPCCSKTLAACTRRPGAAGAEGPPAEDRDEDSDPEGFVRHHGLGSREYTLEVELSSDSLKVHEDEDNLVIIHVVRDTLRLIQNKFLPAVCSWVQLFTRAGTRGRHLEGAIDLKAELETALRRSRELDVMPEEGCRREAAAPRDEDEDDDDFVEVPEKEGYEACVPEHLQPECGLEKDPATPASQARKRTGSSEEACDPTSAAAQLHWLQRHLPPASPPSPRVPLGPEEAKKLAAERARAPVVPFGVDLCYWGREEPMAGKILKSDSEHRFWKPREVDTEVESAAVSESLRSRQITFAGRFEPVQHRCRAPRPDGRLCERQDRLKCPFHGKIIPRDDTGRPLHPEDRAREQKQKQQLQGPAGRPAWQDPELMRDVEATTGVHLGSSRPGGKGRRRRSGLTDLKRQADTARARIAKKVFAKAAVQRVVTAMNQMDRKKHEKFANQFNYALN
ncbi:UV-stimulated scaffold protein A [Delphinapterus leucas]|uniref:UV-stimulated scaffold protein A n=1 Tax=Delphinapterus leucas TaxID=9749 RepID=A0A2Y9LP64_DELLE|nr:UV-stimulated scaffold protein A [Delphinapterus leucas]XP_022410526.1 UV-stimulated scaffold protein A [Delphinapterus leucas]XP_022410527.1 UV-stimulated scaffold protein A [Delphinapterus leucas]